MIRPELDALLQGALDDTLTSEERDRSGRLMTESPEARARAAQLGQLTSLLDSLGPADAPVGLVHDVLSQISNQPHSIRRSTQRRGTPVNKRILIGLAAAAAVVLAVITYSTNPPATEGTEATIGAAQRAQAPQIAAKDVALGDTSAQDVLQTELWDQLAKDEDLRTLLTDANFREHMLDANLRLGLSDETMLKFLRDPSLGKKLEEQAVKQALTDPNMVQRLKDANMRQLLSNPGVAKALENNAMRGQLLKASTGAALSRQAFQNALRSGKNFEASLQSQRFAEHMARAKK